MAERIALVTGANRGIGLEIVRELAGRGLRTILASRDEGKGAHAAAALIKAGLPVETLALDVASITSIDRAMDELESRFGRLDVLVNNAGLLLDRDFSGSFLKVPADAVLESFLTNALGPYRLMQRAVPLMRTNGYGRIVNLSSRLGQVSTMGTGYPSYGPSKAALNAMTRVAAAEVGDANIKINTMHPGWVRSDMGGPNATSSIAEGADTAVWLATLPDDGPTGGFFAERMPMAW